MATGRVQYTHDGFIIIMIGLHSTPMRSVHYVYYDYTTSLAVLLYTCDFFDTLYSHDVFDVPNVNAATTNRAQHQSYPQLLRMHSI